MKLFSLCNPLQPLYSACRHGALLKQLVRRQMAVRYRGSVLGYLWTLSHPLLMLAVYTFVFGLVFKARWGGASSYGTADFAVIMFCGMAVFNIFSETVNNSALCIINNTNFVKKVVFPLELLPLAQVLSSTALGMVWFVLVVLGALTLGLDVTWKIVFFPVVLLPLMLFSLGAGYFVAAATVYLRDIPHLTAVGVQILFFMTPVFYPIDMVPEQFRVFLYFNPLTSLVEECRNILLFAKYPDSQACLMLWAASLLICQLGFIWFQKTKKGFADVL